ncbi:hypothetical protein IQ235_02915 [Oscillatoriales cyanobacterium LEGE 11467]|uniref:CheR-type methyltransferase domain-containing protein n=1 Tax=Zarconia navalis LEGE 11467 TaxID=1828826 RepID=A0A928Z7J1_9CYAN|nr:CheR family methyltransferase [Zarconia navalis]MBE9039743.1 hypothetical protein [Zarconia navalis LEGE 11467]
MNNSQRQEQWEIKTFLTQKMGFNPEAIGTRAIANAIARRMKACGMRDDRTYLKYLQTSRRELDALIEYLVIPETWFFRHRESFNFLRDFVSSLACREGTNRIFRVLSVPCSTGEEPYSIAIALMDAGLMASQIQIDAIDLSQVALTKAKQALYSRYSFREGYGPQRQRYFEQTPDGERVRDFVRQTVRFSHGNLLDPTVYYDRQPYNIIFCRNLLIYFSPSARKRARQILSRLLAPRGLLFVGYAETASLAASGFVLYSTPRAFAYQKVTKTLQTDTKVEPLGKKVRQHAKDTTKHITKHITKTIASNSESPIERARQLANWGEVQDAIALCELYLQQNPTSASTYVLLGEIYQSKGCDEQAEQCFQKALYLDPERCICLVYLALLQEGRGDIAGANVLRQRYRRFTQSHQT